MSDSAATLNTLSDKTLSKIGRKLDAAGDGQNWLALIRKLPQRLYSDYEGKKRIEEIARERFRQLPQRQLGSSGYALLLDLRRKNVTVNELVEALEALQQEECLEDILPREGPTIVTQPLAVPVMVGGTIVLTCKARGFPLPKYQWFVSKGHDPVILRNYFKSKLEIRDAKKEHEGHYCCRVTNELDVKFSHYAEVRVAQAEDYAPDDQSNRKPAIVKDLQDKVEEDIDSTIQLHIEAEGSEPLQYEWFKNTKLMDACTEATLILTNTQPASTNGMYSCRISNQYGSAISKFCTVRVNASIKIIQDLPQQKVVAEGDTLRLEVRVRGDPLPGYRWWKTTLFAHSNQSESSVILHAFRESVLCIENVQKEDSGVYICEISNGNSDAARRHSAACRVVISEKSEHQIKIVEHPKSHAVELNESVLLRCRAEPSDQVQYQWFKENADSPIAAGNGSDLTVKIESERDWGFYMCSVSLNSQSEVSLRALIYDLLPVRIDPQHIRCGIDTKVELRCVADDAYCIDECEWFKDSNRIPRAKDRVLVIHNPTIRDLGQYGYIAISKYGRLQSQLQALTVIDPPRVSNCGSPTIVRVCIGDSFELKCDASGDDLTYQWMHGTDESLIDGAMLSVYQVERCNTNDLGNYTCYVRNAAGKDSATYVVERLYDSVRVVLEPVNVRRKEGDEMRLKVNLNANGDDFTYRWFLNDQAFPDFINYQELVIRSVESGHEGVYHCVVYDSSGQQFKSNNSRLEIIRGPQIKSEHRFHRVRHGESFQLGVDAEGVGPLSYFWLKDNKPLMAFFDPHRSFVNLGKMTPAMAGNYVCQVRDSRGMVSEAPIAHIDVTGIFADPETRSHFSMLSTTSNSSNEASLSIRNSSQLMMPRQTETATSVPLEITTANQKGKTKSTAVIGERKDRVSDYVNIMQSMSSFHTQHEYDLNDGSRSGQYESCVPPAIVIEPKDQEIVVGQELVLTCQANGTPALRYQWYFQGKRFGNESQDNSVKLSAASQQNSGRYYCEVSNYKATARTVEVQVNVREGHNLIPRFIRSPKPEIKFPVGVPLVIPYDIEGEQPIEIEWKKDGKTIVAPMDESTYTIPVAKESDSGTYECVISNAHGRSVSRPTRVIVFPASTA